MIYKFRMLSDEDEHFVRDFELPYNATLKEFHALICEEIAYDDFEMCSMFLCNEQWMKLREFTLIDMGVEESDSFGEEEIKPVTMDSVLLAEVMTEPSARMLFVFDLMEDRAFLLELIDIISPAEGITYPRVRFANGDAPDQYHVELGGRSKSIFDEAMDDYDGFGGEEELYEDEF